MPVGNYTFYFKYADIDGNESPFIGETGNIVCHVGSINEPTSIRGGLENENSHKLVQIALENLDPAYDYIYVYYTHTSSAQGNEPVTVAKKIKKKYVTKSSICFVNVTGDEETIDIPISEIQKQYFVVDSVKTQVQCKNRLFLANLTQPSTDLQTFTDLSLRMCPYYKKTLIKDSVGKLNHNYEVEEGGAMYYNVDNIYNKVGYWNEEIYRLGVVYIMNDDSLSQVYNISGCNGIPLYQEGDSQKYYTSELTDLKNVIVYDEETGLIKQDYDSQVGEPPEEKLNLENAKGVIRIEDSWHAQDYIHSLYIKVSQDIINKLKELNTVKGFFFVRQKRVATILAQAFVIGHDTVSGLPVIPIKARSGKKDSAGSNQKFEYISESFTDSSGVLTQNYKSRLFYVNPDYVDHQAAICPEYSIRPELYGSMFTDDNLVISLQKRGGYLVNDEYEHRHWVHTYHEDDSISYDQLFQNSKVIAVYDSCPIKRNRDNLYRAKAGYAESATDFLTVGEDFDLTYNYPPKVEYVYSEDTKNAMLISAGLGVITGGLGALVAGGIALWGSDKIEIDTRPWIEEYEAVIENGKGKTKRGYKRNIARGEYGPFIGITGYQGNPCDIINIYISNYNTGQMKNYFQIRQEDQSPYYAICDRIPLKNIKEGGLNQEIFRGDCYVCQYTQRLNRNFQDPSAPTADTMVDDMCWRNNYKPKEEPEKLADINLGDVNAVQIGSWITFTIKSNTNLSMRDEDSSYIEESLLMGHTRGFYPLQPISVDGSYKLPEAAVINTGISAQTSQRMHWQQSEVPYKKNCFQTRIAYSDIAITDAYKNGYRVFNQSSWQDYPTVYGGIMKLVEVKDSILVIFEHGMGLLPINERVMAGSGAGGDVSINSNKVLPDTLNMISTDYGTQWPDSVIQTPYAVYGIDTVAKKLWRYKGGALEILSHSQFGGKVQRFLNEHITLTERELDSIVGVRNVKSHYNAFKQDVMFTFYDNLDGFEEEAWNLCYNEITQKFTTFYSWIPSFSANIDNIFFTFDRNTSKNLSKLGLSNKASTESSSIVVEDVKISNWEYISSLSDIELYELTSLNSLISGSDQGISTYIKNNNYKYCELDVKGMDFPKRQGYTYVYNFTLERDRFGHYKYFDLACSYDGLQFKYYLIMNSNVVDTLVKLNIVCDVIPMCPGQTNNSIYSTLKKQLYLNNGCSFSTDFWKHGKGGIIDIQEKLKPAHWYGEQHPFEFEFVVNAQTPDKQKIFDSLQIFSNNVAPESFHYEIVGDSFDFTEDKPNMYVRQEATKHFLQNNGSDVQYNANYKQLLNNVQQNTKSILFPQYYFRQDTYNELFDKYLSYEKEGHNYNQMTGSEIVYDELLNQFSIVTHVKAVSIADPLMGRLRGNMWYKDDTWSIQINPLNFVEKNENIWPIIEGKQYPPISTVHNIPDDIQTVSTVNIPEGFSLDNESWSSARQEARLRDKYIKIKIRYKGDKLSLVTGTRTTFRT